MDLDANGVSKYFAGPFYFGGTGWEWDPAFNDIGWAGVSAGDYGTMTFDLIGDAHFSANNKMFPDLSGTGKFMLYPATNQLATIGAQVIHDKAEGNNVLDWNAKMTIKTLDARQCNLSLRPALTLGLFTTILPRTITTRINDFLNALITERDGKAFCVFRFQ